MKMLKEAQVASWGNSTPFGGGDPDVAWTWGLDEGGHL